MEIKKDISELLLTNDEKYREEIIEAIVAEATETGVETPKQVTEALKIASLTAIQILLLGMKKHNSTLMQISQMLIEADIVYDMIKDMDIPEESVAVPLN